MNILQSIFTDYYEHIIYELHPRHAVIENVNKMIHCGDPSHGGAMYGCPHCGNLKFIPFRCKSRFALPAETNTISSVLSICPASSLPVFIAIVYSLSRKNFVIIFLRTDLS